jgi:hypothetical protein
MALADWLPDSVLQALGNRKRLPPLAATGADLWRDLNSQGGAPEDTLSQGPIPSGPDALLSDYASRGLHALNGGPGTASREEQHFGSLADAAAYTNPVTALPLAAYHAGEALSDWYDAAQDPSPHNFARAGLSSGLAAMSAVAPAAGGQARGLLDDASAGLLATSRGGSAAAGTGAGAGLIGSLVSDEANAAQKSKPKPVSVAPGTDLDSLAAKYSDDTGVQTALARYKAATRDGVIGPAAKDALQAFQDAVSAAAAPHEPFDKKFPELSQTLPFVAGAGPMALGLVAHGAGNLSESLTNLGWRGAINRGMRAMSESDAPMAARYGNVVKAYQDAYVPPTLAGKAGAAGSDLWHTAGLMGGGALIGAEARALPYQYNANYADPGSPAQVEGAKMRGAAGLEDVYLPGAAVGAVGALSGSHIPLPKINAPLARSRGFLGDLTGGGIEATDVANRMAKSAAAQQGVDAMNALGPVSGRDLQALSKSRLAQLQSRFQGADPSPYQPEPPSAVVQTQPQLPPPEPPRTSGVPPSTNRPPINRAPAPTRQDSVDITNALRDIRAREGSLANVTPGDLKKQFPKFTDGQLQSFIDAVRKSYPIIGLGVGGLIASQPDQDRSGLGGMLR